MATQSLQQLSDLKPVIYKGQPVLTLSLIDSIHQRTSGTASRNFIKNKSRLIEGEDFYLVDFTKNSEFRCFEIEVPVRGLTVLTETGYLMLVKSFTDDLAWQVQRHLVKHYFRAKSEPKYQAPLQIGAPILADELVKELNNSARRLSSRHYTHYRNRLITEALKGPIDNLEQIPPIVEKVWQENLSGDTIDGVKVSRLKESFELVQEWFIAQHPVMTDDQRVGRLGAWRVRMNEFCDRVGKEMAG